MTPVSVKPVEANRANKVVYLELLGYVRVGRSPKI